MSIQENKNELARGVDLREKGQLPSACRLLDDAHNRFLFDKNYSDAVQALWDLVLCWMHIYRITKDRAWLIKMRHGAQTIESLVSSLEIFEKRPLANYAQASAHMEAKSYDKAAELYFRAVEGFTGSGDQKKYWTIKRNVARALSLGIEPESKGSEKEGVFQANSREILRLLVALKDKEKDSKDLEQFNLRVWISSSYFDLAEMWRPIDGFKASTYFTTARIIVEDDSRLFLQRKRLERIRQHYIAS